VPCFFIHGNRDFLLGDAYARRARMTLLPDPCVIEIEGERVLLMHGDTLCTDDAPYQAFRAQSRDSAWQRAFLARPLVERQAFAAQAREESQRYTRAAAEGITDVNSRAVVAALRARDVLRLIHGHTHRPAQHRLDMGGTPAERIVLGDWYEQGSVLRAEEGSAPLLHGILEEEALHSPRE
jgi:UDP-2,3-diacylglucosamine hydrolase